MATLQKHRRAVRRFEKIMRFGAWMQDLPNRMTPPPFRLLQIGSAFWQSRALYVAAKLDIATVLADGTSTTESLAGHLSADSDALYRLLRMLAAMDVFEEASDRSFRNNRISAFLREDHPQSVRAMILMHNSEVMSRPWYEQLERGVLGEGVPFGLTHGTELFDYMDDHAEFDALFSRAMDGVEALIGDTFATDFDWGQFTRVIDVGGSRGSKSLAILKHHPGLQALVIDRPQVIEEARQYWRGHGDEPLLSRMSFEPGDVLDSIPHAEGPGDIYFLSAVLHGFGDEQCVTALRNLASAASDGGARIAIMELVVNDTGADYAQASFDMQMFMGTRGRERTLAEWRALFEKSGLELEEVVRLRSLVKILVLRPQGKD